MIKGKRTTCLLSSLLGFAIGWGVAGIIGWVAVYEDVRQKVSSEIPCAPQSPLLDSGSGLAFRPNGWYLPPHNPNMEEVEVINFGIGGKYGGRYAAVLVGQDLAELEEDPLFVDLQPSIDDDKLELETNQRGGTWFVFQGVMCKPSSSNGEWVSMLIGTLRKYQFGDQVAETTGKFVHVETLRDK